MTSPLASLPTEIILEIIPHISYTSHALASFCMTCARFNSIVRAHEYSLVHAITQRQFPPTTLALFPGLSGQADCCVTSQSSSNEDEVSTEAEPAAGPLPTTRPITLPHAHVLGPQTFADLSTLHARLDTLHEIHSHWLQIVNHGPDLQWLKGRWENIHKAGLLLLYRLQDAGRRPASYFSSSSSGLAPPDAMQTYIAQLELLHALPGPSLACLLFKLLASIRILRVHGPTPIHATTTWGASIDPAQQRQDIELACEESLLKHGPAFFVALLRDGQASLGIKSRTRSWAVNILETETALVLPRQLPFATGEPKPTTLIASLRRALAARTGCAVADTAAKMWEILSSTPFDVTGDDVVARLVNGDETVGEGGYRRMGY